MLLFVPLLLSLTAFWILDGPSADRSLFQLANLVGPSADNLLHGHGLMVCTDAMGTVGNPICFHAGRMPLPSVVVALGVMIFGNHYLAVGLFKMLLLLIPLEIAFWVVWRRLPRSRLRRGTIVLLLLVPFGMTPLLADVVNMQVEEGYSYSFLALAAAILFFGMDVKGGDPDRNSGIGRAALFAVAVAAIYLAKSSMMLAAAALTIAFVVRERRYGPRALVLLLVAAAPVGWALHQHHASGRYSLGTSIDGINLRKGNNNAFLDRYPPPPGDSLDRFDPTFNKGLHFSDEWSFNDFHEKAAIAYLRTHPQRTVVGGMRKFDVLFVSIRKIGSSGSPGVMLAVETAGLVLFRVLLWTAIGCAVLGLWQRRRFGWATAGRIFLLLLAVCSAPYLIGFGYTRHASILIYPAVLMCCAVLADQPDESSNVRSASSI